MIESALFALAYRRFLAACENPLDAQARRLRRILAQAARSDAGRRHDFARLARIAPARELVREFQRRVPVRNHEAMRGDLDAVYAGDWRRLCPSPPVFFALTAGSTGRFKHVPVTAEFRRELGRGSMIFYGALEACFPALRQLKAQFLAGSAEGGRSPTGIPQGFVSGFNYRHLPWIVRRRFVLPYWVFTLDDADERSYAAGRILIDARRLGVLGAISPINLVNLRQSLERNAERLFHDLARGTLTVRHSGPVRGTYRGRPDPALADTLRGAWLKDGALPTRLLFPSLQVLVCWQGGNMSYYLDELAEAFETARRFEFPISASEGLFAVPCESDRAGGVLAVTSHFLEFLADDAPAAADAEALTADQLETGGRYRLVVTNSAGFYRYDMEDIVRVRARYLRTPVIEFVSKTVRQVSVSNERLSELDVTVAMRAASGRCGVRFREFLFVPCSDRRYRVIVDGSGLAGGAGRPADAQLQEVAGEVERQLRLASKGYDFEREDALLEPLRLVVTAEGQLEEYLRRRQGAQPIPNAQLKPMHLTSEFGVPDGLTPVKTYAA